MRERDKRPDGRVHAMQQDGAPDRGAFEDGVNAVRDLARGGQVLFLDLDENAQHAVVVGEADEALRIGDGGEARLDADTAQAQQVHHHRSVGLRQVDRGVIGQFAPCANRGAGALLVVLDPGTGRDADQRARTGAAHGQHSVINGSEAFASVRPARMDVQFGGARGDARGGIARHRLRGERQLRVEVAGTGAVDAGLDDHGRSSGRGRQCSGAWRGGKG